MIRKTNLAHRGNYGNKRSASSIKYIVLHYTANDGDSDENNGKYFNGANRNASAHIFVDDDSCTQSVPDNYVAWSVGGSKYANTKGGSLYGKATNANTLNIEMCDTDRNGRYEATAETQKNTIAIVREKMSKYNIPIERVIRHYDVTGKLCPAYFVDEDAWKAFKAKITGSNVSIGGSSAKPSGGSSSGSKPTIYFKYRVKTAQDGWLPEVVNLADYAGIPGHAITDIAIGVDRGSLWYQVHVKGGGWLPAVTGYDINDYNNGYAGNGKVIDAVRVYYNTPADYIKKYGYQKAQYRVSPLNGNYWPWQYDNETGGGQDGYAGAFGYALDKFQLF